MQKHSALALAALLAATIFGCGGEDNPTRTPDDESGPTEGSTPSEGEESPASPSCSPRVEAGKEEATCSDLPTPTPDPEVQPDPADDPDPTEETPPVVADPCAEFPWLKEADGEPYRCGSNECTLELPPQPDGICAARCQPAFYKPAEELERLDGRTFTFNTEGLGERTCSPLN